MAIYNPILLRALANKPSYALRALAGNPPTHFVLRRTSNNPMSEDQTTKYYYVYILLCSDGQLYTGCTGNLKDRYSRHQRGEVISTKDRRPLKLLWCCAFPDRTFAFAFEKYLKSGSGRAFARKRLIEIK